MVAGANILLNGLVATAAKRSAGWLDVYATSVFWLAFLVGIISLLAMSSLYFYGREDRFGMANGILLMGVLSIVGGTLSGYFVMKNTVHWYEWILFALILCSIALRYFAGTQR